MSKKRTKYSNKFKAKLVLEILKGEKSEFTCTYGENKVHKQLLKEGFSIRTPLKTLT